MSSYTYDDLADEIRERLEFADAAALAIDDAVGVLIRISPYAEQQARLLELRSAAYAVSDRLAADALRALRTRRGE